MVLSRGRRERAMAAFFISSDNPETDLQRCHESQKFLSRPVITGANEQGEIKLFEGVVESIEDQGENAPKGRRWRVLMIDEF
jgi:hypothetical protein